MAYIRIYQCPIPIQELRAEEAGGLIIHHGLIIRTIRYILVDASNRIY